MERDFETARTKSLTDDAKQQELQELEERMKHVNVNKKSYGAKKARKGMRTARGVSSDSTPPPSTAKSQKSDTGSEPTKSELTGRSQFDQQSSGVPVVRSSSEPETAVPISVESGPRPLLPGQSEGPDMRFYRQPIPRSASSHLVSQAMPTGQPYYEAPSREPMIPRALPPRPSREQLFERPMPGQPSAASNSWAPPFAGDQRKIARKRSRESSTGSDSYSHSSGERVVPDRVAQPYPTVPGVAPPTGYPFHGIPEEKLTRSLRKRRKKSSENISRECCLTFFAIISVALFFVISIILLIVCRKVDCCCLLGLCNC